MSTAVKEIVTPYHQTDRFTLYEGDCRSVLSIFADYSFDSVVCDPPYELGFMGKGWDRSGIAYDVSVWRECLRALKPGGHLLASGGSRTYHRLACAIEDAGFEIRDQIQWLYGSGFPKSLDVSKAIDACGGKAWAGFAGLLDSLIKQQGFNYTTLDQALGIPSAGSNSCYWVRADERGGLPPRHYYEQLKVLLSPPPEFTDLYDKAEREVIAIQRRKNAPNGIVGIGRPSVDIDREITVAATDAARQWQGWGTALKPAHEPIVLARKPLIGTVAENVLQHGTGGLNIDGCRIETNETLSAGSRRLGDGVKFGFCEPTTEYEQNANGRWPANVIHDGSDEVLSVFPDAPGQQGDLSGHSKDRLSKGIFGDMKAARDAVARLDSGSAARFFYCAKASQEDRNEGCEDLPHRPAGALKSGDGGWRNEQERGRQPRHDTQYTARNNHPTVKPTELMRYLCRLVTPPCGLVLDPFMGSGSTGKAAMLEGFKFVGIELNAEYCELAQRRIEAVTRQGLLFG